MTDEIMVMPEGMARLNITIEGMNGDVPDFISYDLSDGEIKTIASESVESGYVPGIEGVTDADFTDFVVDRFPATAGVAFNRLVLRPKTPFGTTLL